MTNSGAADVDLSYESQNNIFTQNTSETQISKTDILNTLDNKNDNSEEETNTIGSTTPSLEPNLMLSGSSVTVSEDNNNQSLNNKPTQNFPITSEAIKPTVIHSTSSLHSAQPSVLDRRSSISRGTSPIKELLVTTQVQDKALHPPITLPFPTSH